MKHKILLSEFACLWVPGKTDYLFQFGMHVLVVRLIGKLLIYFFWEALMDGKLFVPSGGDVAWRYFIVTAIARIVIERRWSFQK